MSRRQRPQPDRHRAALAGQTAPGGHALHPGDQESRRSARLRPEHEPAGRAVGAALLANDPEKIRSYFRRLRELRDFIREQNIPNVEMNALSMGMSSDFEIAIEEGANYIRIGTALFGKRKRAAKPAAPKSEETL